MMNKLSPKETILAIDIGGSRIKSTLLNAEGSLLKNYEKIATPHPSTPEKVLEIVKTFAEGFKGYTKISVGFPGYVRDGVIKTAPNLDTALWKEFDLKNALEKLLGKPVIVLNDADMQGLGVSKGTGFEIAITLGTGFGTAFLMNGKLLPHFELAHHPVTKHKTYDDFVGERAFEKIGIHKWNLRMRHVLETLKTVFNYDHLYIGGGNSSKINFELTSNMTLVTNLDGIHGGAKAWINDFHIH